MIDTSLTVKIITTSYYLCKISQLDTLLYLPSLMRTVLQPKITVVSPKKKKNLPPLSAVKKAKPNTNGDTLRSDHNPNKSTKTSLSLGYAWNCLSDVGCDYRDAPHDWKWYFYKNYYNYYTYPRLT